MSRRTTILGAGLAGLSAGHTLVKGGETVSLLEKEDYIGGLAASFKVGEYTIDLGPHRFHTRNKRVHAQVEDLLATNAHWKNRLSRIYLRGKFFNYPLNAGNVVRNLPPWLLAKAFLDYLWVRAKNAVKPIPDDCFQNWVLKRFGKTLYDLFFGTYTEKAWGIPCTQVSADWASQRITLLSLWDTVKKTLFRPKNVPRTLVSKFIYPKHGGVGQIAERLGEEIRKQPGNSIQTGVRIKRIRWSGDKVTSVEYEKDGLTRDEPVELLVSTIPLTVALELFDPAPPPEVMTSKDTLRYKAIVFVFLIVDRPKVTDDHWVYLPEKHLRVHRISEFKNFSEFSAPEGKTLVAAEITCNYEDETWNMDTPALVELAKKDLATAGLIQPHEVHEGFVRRERYSYPLYDLVYREHVKRCLDFMKGFTNFHSSGRQGLFQYGNMDHSLAMGLVLGEKLLRGEGVDHDKLLEEEESVDG